MKKKTKQSTADYEENDDSFWDIAKTFEPKVRKPAITFGQKKSTRLKNLRSNRLDTVNIFSTIKKSSLIIKPKDNQIKSEEEDDSKDKERLKSLKKQIEKHNKRSILKSESFKKEQTDSIDDHLKLPSRKESGEMLLNETPIIKALDPPAATGAQVLSPRKTTTTTPSITQSSPQESISLSRKRPLDFVAEDQAPDSPVLSNESTQPTTISMKKDKGKGRAFEILPQKSTISLSKKKKIPDMTYLQSTPSRSQKSVVQATDIFGDLLLSPIVPSYYIEHATPTIHQPQSMIPINGKALPQPPSPTRHEPMPILNLGDLIFQQPTISGEEKKMKVEDYLHHVIDKSIQKIKSHGEQIISKIQEKSDLIKQELQQHLD